MPSDDRSIELEEKKFALDAEMRRREMSVKEAESKQRGWSTAQASVAGAILALLSGVAGAGIAAWSTQNVATGQSLTSLEIEKIKVEGNLGLERTKQQATDALERKRFETSLILDAIKTPSRTDAVRNLKFFVAAGFVSDPDGRIGRLSDDSLPSIGMPRVESATKAIQSTGTVTIDNSIICTGALISPRHVITPNSCVQRSGVTTPPNITFKIGEKVFPVKKAQEFPDAKLAVLEITGGTSAEIYLDRSRIRAPVIGERIYLAVQLPNRAVELRTCTVIANTADPRSSRSDFDFRHNCETGSGSAGAVVIAVSDDALLGIHHSRGPSFPAPDGIATRLVSVLPLLEPLLSISTAQQPSAR